MNIAVDCRSVFPGRGGIGRYAENLGRLIPTMDQRNHYVYFTTDRQKEIICNMKRIQQIPFSVGMIDPIWEQLHLPNNLQEFEVDLYHNPCFSLPIAQKKSKMITTIHDVVFRERPDLVPPSLCEYLDRWTAVAVKIAHKIITVSEYSKQKIIALYNADPEKIEVIYNGVDSQFFPHNKKQKTKIREKYHLPENYILYLGSIEKKKNIAALLNGYTAIVNKVKMPLVIAGAKIGNSIDLQKLSENLKDKIIPLGYIPENDIASLISAAKVFVYPSLYEGFGLPPLEAMASGTPVLVSNATSLPEVVGNAALLFESTNIDSLAVNLEKLCLNKDLQQDLIKKGKKHAKKFTWKKCALETINVYKKVLNAS